MKGRKRLLALALSIACLVLAAGGSLAYFTTQRDTKMLVQASSVKLRALLLEERGGVRQTADPSLALQPGESSSRIAAASNTGKADAWIRARVEILLTRDAQQPQAYPLQKSGVAGLDQVRITGLDESRWTYLDGYWYYNAALKAGETTEPLFTGVSLDKSMDNAFASSRIALQIDMQATQVAHNGASALEANGWPGE